MSKQEQQKQQRIADRAKAKLLSLLPNLDIPEVTATPHVSPVSKTLQADSVIIFLDTRGKGFVRETCPQCKQVFAAHYIYRTRGMLCSDECRIADLAARGIRWDPTKGPSERWHRRVPIVVPPQALAILDEQEKERSQAPKQPPSVPDDIPVPSASSQSDFEALMADLDDMGF